MSVRWTTAFLDRPADTFDDAVAFWVAVTGSALSPARGDHDEFATLVPPDGDAYLRVQRVQDGPGGSHLDLHVDDVAAFTEQAIDHGAEQLADHGGTVSVMRSPAGYVWCVVRHHGEAEVPAGATLPGTALRNVVDQLCIDIPHAAFDDECRFWSALTGWELGRLGVDDFLELRRPAGQPLRLLLQRRHDDDGPARSHLDVGNDDLDTTVDHHVDLGATVVDRRPRWTVLADPARVPYCVVKRRPHR